MTYPSTEIAPDWERIDPLAAVGAGRSFVSGDPQSDRIVVEYFLRRSDQNLTARVWFGPGAEGPPGYAHGGSIAAVLDEAMGVGAWISGHKVVAAQLVTNFRRMIALGSKAIVETAVGSVDGRKVVMRARLVDSEGELLADAEGLFVVLDPERLAALAFPR